MIQSQTEEQVLDAKENLEKKDETIFENAEKTLESFVYNYFIIKKNKYYSKNIYTYIIYRYINFKYKYIFKIKIIGSYKQISE